MGNLKLSERACFVSPPFIATADGTAKTGITVTANIYRLNTDGSLTAVATGSATTEIGTTAVFYLTSTATATAGTYWALFITADTTVAAREMTGAPIVIGLGGHENLDGTVSSRASQISLDTVDDLLDTEIPALTTAVAANNTAIAALESALPADPADASDIAASFATVNATLGTIGGYLDTEVAALTTAVAGLVTAVAALETALPSDPADASVIAAAFATTDAAIAALLAVLTADRVTGTTTGTPTTTSVPTTGSDLSSTDDVYNGGFLVLTSGAQKAAARKITDYNGTTKTFTTQPFPSAPASGVTVAVIGNVPS